MSRASVSRRPSAAGCGRGAVGREARAQLRDARDGRRHRQPLRLPRDAAHEAAARSASPGRSRRVRTSAASSAVSTAVGLRSHARGGRARGLEVPESPLVGADRRRQQAEIARDRPEIGRADRHDVAALERHEQLVQRARARDVADQRAQLREQRQRRQPRRAARDLARSPLRRARRAPCAPARRDRSRRARAPARRASRASPAGGRRCAAAAPRAVVGAAAAAQQERLGVGGDRRDRPAHVAGALERLGDAAFGLSKLAAHLRAHRPMQRVVDEQARLAQAAAQLYRRTRSRRPRAAGRRARAAG